MPDTDQQAKSLPTLIGELWQLVVEYFKQETVGRLRGLLRYIGFGVAGSLLALAVPAWPVAATYLAASAGGIAGNVYWETTLQAQVRNDVASRRMP